MVGDGRESRAEESESMGGSGESSRFESESESVRSSLRRFFPVMGKKGEGTGELRRGKQMKSTWC